MALGLLDIKTYCKVDYDAEDKLLLSLLEAAQALIDEQTGKTLYVGTGSASIDIHDRPLYQTAVKQLILHWFENRGTAAVSQPKDIPFSVDMLIGHFKYSGEYA